MTEFGLESCYNTVNTEYNAVAKLDATHVVVTYKDTGGSGYGCAKVGVIDGNTVTWGAENVFNSANTTYISVTALDSTHFVVGYADTGGAAHGCAKVGLVSGTTISSYGAENVFNAAGTQYISVATLDSTHFVVGYKDNGGDTHGHAKIGVVSTTTISSYGAENTFNSVLTGYISVAALDSTHFVATYKDDGGDDYGCARVGLTDGGTTISSYGTENIFNSAAMFFTSVATLDSTHFVVGYRNAGDNHGYAKVGLTDGGTTISSYGSANEFNSATMYHLSVAVLDSTHFVVEYDDPLGDTYGHTRVGLTNGGTTISSYGTEQTFNSAVTTYGAVAALSATDYIVVYKDDGGADYGCGRVWGTAGWSGTIMGVSSPAKVMGIAVANVTKVIGIS